MPHVSRSGTVEDQDANLLGLGLEAEFEHVAVPIAHRKNVPSVAAVWFGFPMIVTSAVFGGVIVAELGFPVGLAAIALGNLILFLYVGALSYLSGQTGLNFSLLATRVFGTAGYTVATGFLATIVTGWFAFQTGLTGAVVHSSFGINESLVILLSGLLYMAITFLGIRALSVLGAVAAPLFVLLALVSIGIAWKGHSLASLWAYHGVAPGTATLSLGAGITMVVAGFADSGTMTGDFTRWSRSGWQGVAAAASAFPVANFIALISGAVIVALGSVTMPAVNGGNFLPLIAHGHGPLLSAVAFIFIFVNLGSVCTHCLYNGSVGWGHITGRKMRLLTIILGVIGTLIALTGVWSQFLTWLSLLGIFVPPIGAVVLADQFLMKSLSVSRPPTRFHTPAFAGWAVGAAAAALIHFVAPAYSEALVGLASAACAYVVIARIATFRGANRALEIGDTEAPERMVAASD